jgi:hypothetical protein
MSLFDDASLVLIPDGAKDSKLYSVKPTDGGGDFTFSRGSNLAATRVNENGLIEKGRENLLLYSEEFDDAYWTKTRSAIVSDSISAPDGTLTADKLNAETDVLDNYVVKSFSVSSGTSYVLSVFAKSSEYQYLVLRASTPSYDQVFNLSTGTLGNSNGTGSATIENYGDGWYRCSIIFTTTTTTLNNLIKVSSTDVADGASSTTSGNGIYIWGAQLEVGSVATEYIQSTSTTGKAGVLEDLPRIDYSEGGCPSLLLEPQRTNLATYSEDFSNAAWSKTGATISADSTTSPDGTSNADTLTGNGSDLTIRLLQIVTLSAGTYTLSFFVKKNNHRFASILFSGFSSGDKTAFYDLDSEITDNADATITPYNNGWYLCTLTTTISGPDLTGTIRLYAAGSYTQNAFASTADANGKSIYVWGAQLEAGSYPTSYIPTNSAAVTRNADSCELTGVADLLGDSEGTLYFEGSVFDADGSGFGITLSDGTTNNRVYIGKNSSATPIRAIVNVGGVAQFDNTASNWIDNTTIKIALKYAANDFALWVNGVEVLSDLSGSTFSDGVLTRLGFDAPNVAPFFGNAKQLTVFPTALTDTELENLTS